MEPAILKQCAWPDLKEPYARALKEAISFILSRFEPIGIIAGGTLIRGEAGPSSDLDIWVLHRPLRRQRLQKWFNGVPAEIFVNPPKRTEAYFRNERRDARPTTSHMIATGFVVLNRDPAVSDLIHRAKAELASPARLSKMEKTRFRYLAATAFEDAVDIQHEDPETALLILVPAIEAAVNYTFYEIGQWVPRRKQLLQTLAQTRPDLAEQVRAFFRARDPEKGFEIAHRIMDKTIGVRGFFEWQSRYEAVE